MAKKLPKAQEKTQEKAQAAPPAAKPTAAHASPRATSGGADPTLQAYTEGLAALYRKEWEAGARLFDEVVRDGDWPELTARARQLLAVCRQRSNGGAPAAPEGDPYLRAVVAKNRGDLAGVLALCREGGRESKDDRFAYLAAAVHAQEGRPEEAARALARAVELNPKNRVHAYHDADFAELRRSKDHRHLFELP
jgi:tetratricopeptide (TPR) repeat protein